MSRPSTRERHRPIGGTLALLALFLAGCAATPPSPKGPTPPLAAIHAPHDAEFISRDAAIMEDCVAALHRLGADAAARKRQYFLPREHDEVERVLAQYLACREELQQIALLPTPPNRPSSLCQLACSRLARCDAAMARVALGDAVLRKALNQSFHRAGISGGTCDRIILELTDSRLVSSLPGKPSSGHVVQTSFGDELPAEASPSDPRRQIDEIVRRQTLLLPAAENELWHAGPVRTLGSATRAAAEQVRRGQSKLVAALGRIKNPVAAPLVFTAEQRHQVRDALRPGDILLTYTEGFASNLFIPGHLKHAITFVGTEEERAREGLGAGTLVACCGPAQSRLAGVLSQTRIASGEPADVIESVAEGVLLNNFDRVLTTRVNRLVVLRPRTAGQERAEQLACVLSLVGDEYDFSFDLTDGSDQVCTEVVYRSLQGRGGIDFPLTRHAGCLSLTADEMLRYYLGSGAGKFECILAAFDDDQAPGKARIVLGAEAHAWIAQLPGLTVGSTAD